MNETGVLKEVRASQGMQTGKWAIAISGTNTSRLLGPVEGEEWKDSQLLG